MTRRRELLVFAKNAVANVARGGAASIVALFLPPFLTRSMSRDAFGAWSLVLQLGAYVGYFDFGIQTALARFVAHSTERGDLEYRNRIVSSAFAILTASGAIAFLGILVAAALLPNLFHQLSGSLVTDVRVALLLVGGSLAISLPSSTFASLFIGLQRNEIPAALISIPRLIGAALVVMTVHLGGGLRAMAAVTAGVNLCSFLLQYIAYRRWLSGISISLGLVSRKIVRDLVDYCASLTVWSLGLLLVTGLDVAIVGAYQFGDVAYYAVAATLVTFFTGLFGSLYSAMGAPAAVLHAREDGSGLARMVSATTRIGVILLLSIGIPLSFWARPILKLWVGADYANHAAPILQLLIVANILRICVSPYIIAMISTGEQKHIILVPLLEGAVNLICSLVAGYYLGALGVALGTLIGACVSVGGHIVYTMRRNTMIKLDTSDYVRGSLLRPLLCAMPIIALALLWPVLTRMLTGAYRPMVAIVTCSVTLYLLWTVALTSPERQKLGSRLKLC
jgi:O-antigen/teichoic acid export membrane protein